MPEWGHASFPSSDLGKPRSPPRPLAEWTLDAPRPPTPKFRLPWPVCRPIWASDGVPGLGLVRQAHRSVWLPDGSQPAEVDVGQAGMIRHALFRDKFQVDTVGV